MSLYRPLLISVVLCAAASVARAEPPLINVLYPPQGYVGPKEDPATPHGPPPYPEHAQRCQEGGVIKITLTVAADGTVPIAVASTSTGFADLDAAALIQVRRWRYIPATKDGVPTTVRMVTRFDLTAAPHAPDFGAECTAPGRQAAAEALWLSSGLKP